MEHHPGIGAHGAGDVAEGDKVHGTGAGLLGDDAVDLAAFAEGLAEGPTRGGAVTGGRDEAAAGAHGREGERQLVDQAGGVGGLGGRHLLEVHGAELLGCGDREAGFDLDFLAFGLRLRSLRGLR